MKFTNADHEKTTLPLTPRAFVSDDADSRPRSGAAREAIPKPAGVRQVVGVLVYFEWQLEQGMRFFEATSRYLVFAVDPGKWSFSALVQEPTPSTTLR